MIDPIEQVRRILARFGVDAEELQKVPAGRYGDAYVTVARAECIAALVADGMRLTRAAAAIAIGVRQARRLVLMHERRFGPIEREAK